jgi:hypothetical protein
MKSFMIFTPPPSLIQVIKSRSWRWARNVAFVQQKRNAYRILMGNPEEQEQRPLGTCRRRWQNNIKMDIKEMGGEGVNWIHLAQERDKWQSLLNKVGDPLVS